MKNIIKCLGLVMLLSCNLDDEFDAENLKDILSLRIENNNALSDGVDMISVYAEFPLEFTNEDDNLVQFTVLNKGEEAIVQEPIELIQVDDSQKRSAKVSIRNNMVESLTVNAQISINGIIISDEVKVQFKKAYVESIELSTSSLIVTPSSFNEIVLTTELKRNVGKVSLNSIAETVVLDTLGVARGLFKNYKNLIDADGKISNNFTLANDAYEGKLYVIASSLSEENLIVSDTLILISQK